MAGKMCTGSNDVPSNPILTKAYCRGRRDRIASATPTNPFTVGTPESDTWLKGVSSYAGVANGTTILESAQDCCAERGTATA